MARKMYAPEPKRHLWPEERKLELNWILLCLTTLPRERFVHVCERFRATSPTHQLEAMGELHELLVKTRSDFDHLALGGNRECAVDPNDWWWPFAYFSYARHTTRVMNSERYGTVTSHNAPFHRWPEDWWPRPYREYMRITEPPSTDKEVRYEIALLPVSTERAMHALARMKTAFV